MAKDMAKKPKLSKISIVVFLTVLIWVWADLAQDETLPLRSLVTINVARSTDPALWVTFEDPDQVLQTSVTLTNVILTGPASRVADVRRLTNQGDFEGNLFLAPEQEGMTETGTRSFDVLNFLKQNDEIGRLGLTVVSCEPRNLTVQIRQLVRRSIRVECVDQNGNPIAGAILNPPQVDAFVPQDVTYTARIQLTEAEQRQATIGEIARTPYVQLAPDQRRDLSASVKITLPSEQLALAEYPVQRATLGFCFSPVLQGKYQVELQNEAELQSVFVRATPTAIKAYEDQRFKIFLYILDADREATGWITRDVVFNFPEEFVRSGEIQRGNDPPPPAVFRLVPVAEEIQEAP